ncbi:MULTISPECIES: entericidin A/B family lipoprotein [Enterobacterales]
MMNRLFKLFFILLVSGALLSGCNTFRGFGQDVEHLGNSISHAASK